MAGLSRQVSSLLPRLVIKSNRRRVCPSSMSEPLRVAQPRAAAALTRIVSRGSVMTSPTTMPACNCPTSNGNGSPARSPDELALTTIS